MYSLTARGPGFPWESASGKVTGRPGPASSDSTWKVEGHLGGRGSILSLSDLASRVEDRFPAGCLLEPLPLWSCLLAAALQGDGKKKTLHI